MADRSGVCEVECTALRLFGSSRKASQDSICSYDLIRSHKRSRSSSEEDEGEGYQPSKDLNSQSRSPQEPSKRKFLSCQGSVISYSSTDRPVTSSKSSFVSDGSVDSFVWHQALDEIALLAAIEEEAQTYASGGGFEFLSPYLITLSSPQVTPSSSPPLESSQDQLPGQDKPFKCPVCPKSFTRNYDLTRHKSSHQDERQHVCRACGRSFNRRDALSRHNIVRGCCAQPGKLSNSQVKAL